MTNRKPLIHQYLAHSVQAWNRSSGSRQGVLVGQRPILVSILVRYRALQCGEESLSQTAGAALRLTPGWHGPETQLWAVLTAPEAQTQGRRGGGGGLGGQGQMGYPGEQFSPRCCSSPLTGLPVASPASLSCPPGQQEDSLTLHPASWFPTCV